MFLSAKRAVDARSRGCSGCGSSSGLPGLRHWQRHSATQLASAASSTVSSPEAKWTALQAWLASRHGGSAGTVELRDCKLGDVTVRGLVAPRGAAEGSTLMVVPLGAAVIDKQVQSPWPGAPWNAALAHHLLSQRALGAASPLAPYLDLLPPSHGCPLTFGEVAVREVQLADAVAAVRSYQQLAADTWAAAGAAGVQPPGCTYADWAWAVSMVQSRTIRMAVLGYRVMLPGACGSGMVQCMCAPVLPCCRVWLAPLQAAGAAHTLTCRSRCLCLVSCLKPLRSPVSCTI